MRIALVDLLFSWPPHGGACVDVYHVAKELHALGHEPHLFMLQVDGVRDRLGADPAALPFPSTNIPIAPDAFTKRAVLDAIERATAAFQPELAIVCSAFFLKPFVIRAMHTQCPVIARYYAYEATAPFDAERFPGGWGVDLSLFEQPEAVRRATLRGIRRELRSGHHSSWAAEYLAAKAYEPGYAHECREAIARCSAAIVYNPRMAELLAPTGVRTAIVPGGVDLNTFSPPAERPLSPRKVILMTGRTTDPAKGFAVLREAGAMLAAKRSDFEIRVTHPDPAINTPWLTAIGWQSHAGIQRLYREADIAVVPSVWPEPFGLVAVEAMACGVPAVVSDTGGLGGIPVHGKSGFNFPVGDAKALATHLETLLDDEPLRQRMGQAARQRAENAFAWPRVVEAHYGPLLAETVR